MTVDRNALAKWFSFVAIGLMVVFFLAVNPHPIITNDSLEYLDHSRDPGAFGMVFKGYRQIGYPFTLMVERWIAGLVGVEPLLFSALVQRLILAGALGYAVWLWRWKATPVVLLALSPSFLVYPNFLLTEGLSVPLSLVLACLVGHFFRITTANTSSELLRGSDATIGSKAAVTLAALAAFVVFALVTLRFPLAVFGLVPVIFVARAIRGGLPWRSAYSAILLIFLLCGGVFTAALAVENENEHGVLSPSALGKPTQYWGAWRITFSAYDENRVDPALAEFWDDGNPHRRLGAFASAYPDHTARADAIDRDIEELLRLAGLDRRTQRFFSILGALRGGRIDDLKSYTVAAVHSDAESIDAAINRNTFALQNGPDAFAERYNEGVLPQAVITPPIFPLLPNPDIRVLLHLLLPIALVGILVLSILRRQWWLGLAYLLPVLVLATAMGWLLLDNVRFLLPGSAYAIAGLSALWDAQPLSSGPRSA